MSVKNFINTENQCFWDNYHRSKLNDWNKIYKKILKNSSYTQEEKDSYFKKCYGQISIQNLTPYNYELRRQKQILNQYKPILLELDCFLKKPFGDITLREYEVFKCMTNKKNKLVHLQGFYIYCITNGIMFVQDREFIKNLVPELYRPLMRFL